MAVQTSVLASSLLFATLLGSICRSGSVRNNSSKLPGETQSTNNPLIPTTANNRTNGSIQSTTLTEISADTEVTLFSTSASVSELQMTTKVETSSNQSNVDKQGSQEGKSNTEVLSVSLSLVLGVLAAVGVVIAVLFVRWKRIRKMKKGFQDELATICLHDELASEALYASWKPFMDTNETSNMKLVIQQSTPDAKSSTATLG